MDILLSTRLHRRALYLGLASGLWSLMLLGLMALNTDLDFLWIMGWVIWLLLGVFCLGMGLAVTLALLHKPHTLLESVLVLGLMGWAVALPVAVILGLPIW
ncbi:hypothetical protein OZ410_07665 [Robiginitalea sp. M366]|uniref:hypothetical protein n=1 Tax=Robiginitalea aestuariiviva TaxID=3036903 RepID=UPI00240D011F|nr:hypothetical protein [Robiginitalea aestuariiviva]MDG1572189.1 hypothetical protein [Robiginitalea aestuariiviva]